MTRRFDLLDENQSKAAARIKQAEKRLLHHLDEAAPMLAALRLLRGADPEAAMLALHRGRAWLAAMLRESEAP